MCDGDTMTSSSLIRTSVVGLLRLLHNLCQEHNIVQTQLLKVVTSTESFVDNLLMGLATKMDAIIVPMIW